MKKVVIVRQRTSVQGTFGTLRVHDSDCLLYSCFTGELPYRDNAPNISCIPAGNYTCQPWHSKKYPNAYNVMNVPGRSGILIHAGNFCGQVDAGYLSNVEGCILVGRALGTIQGQNAVLGSRLALKDLLKIVGQENFGLEIRSAYAS